MSNTGSQSRSSIDLGVQSSSPPVTDSQPKDIPRIPHPPRLQHSPSLPNIWFPTLTGPISREKEKEDQQTMHRPSAPPSPKNKAPAAVVGKDPQTRHVKYASIDPTYRKPSGSKTHTRRRTERDEPHSLLTPPLTPSSSIRTTTSLDGAVSATAPLGREVSENVSDEILDSDTDSTRILMLENISPNVSNMFLEPTVVDALTSAVTENITANGPNSSHSSLVQRDIVKGINTLHLAKGIVPIVFFDVRSAKIARDVILDKKLNDRLKQCIGGGGHGGAQPMELLARHITREELCEELCETLGNSRFLDGIEASFFFSVQKVQHDTTAEDKGDEEVNEGDEREGFSRSLPLEDTPLTNGDGNVLLLQNILKSYGSVRFFKFIQQEVDQHGLPNRIYHVEYHDVRDAETAHQELQNRKMFQMTINVLRRTVEQEGVAKSAGHGGSSVEPFPNSATAGESFNGLNVSPAGAQSQMRQRFVYTIGDETAIQDQSVEPLSQSISAQASPPSGEANSPPYFYTTMPFDASNQNLQVARRDQGTAHIRGCFPEISRAPNLQTMIPRTTMQEQHWEPEPVYRTDCIPPSYSPDGICHYCPSRAAPHAMAYSPPFPPYAFSPSPPTPPIYYPGHIAAPQIMPNMINVVSNPGPSMLGYEYMDARMQPAPYTGAWSYDPAIAAVGPGMAAPSPAPFFLREEGPPARGGDRHSIPYIRSPDPPMQIHRTQTQLQQEVAEATASQSNYRALNFAAPSSSSPSSDHSAALAGADASPSAPSHIPGHDRNQLNIARIINGEDTRTTIMIKNIPNKMSDSDLTAYIGKVCPRKIDFLYLRMDFKNGCNVGYAFVNFIDVEALLHFAKERLGAKWNMFSSEKVLQMSYANYQGKEALVEKFKNSAIMDERESWRPRIFYSSGKDEGLPEPFPAPTHIRRKERSSYNRGTLFPPGVNSHNIAAQSHGLLHNVPRRYLEDMRSMQHHGRVGVSERYQAHTLARNADGGGESRRIERTSAFRSSNQRATQ